MCLVPLQSDLLSAKRQMTADVCSADSCPCKDPTFFHATNRFGTGQESRALIERVTQDPHCWQPASCRRLTGQQSRLSSGQPSYPGRFKASFRWIVCSPAKGLLVTVNKWHSSVSTHDPSCRVQVHFNIVGVLVTFTYFNLTTEQYQRACGFYWRTTTMIDGKMAAWYPPRIRNPRGHSWPSAAQAKTILNYMEHVSPQMRAPLNTTQTMDLGSRWRSSPSPAYCLLMLRDQK